jgi:hypothetical protein
MNLSEKLRDAFEPTNRTTITGFALAAAFSLSGCAGTRLNLPSTYVGGIDAARVVNQSTNGQTLPLKKEAHGVGMGITKSITCTIGSLIANPQCAR